MPKQKTDAKISGVTSSTGRFYILKPPYPNLLQ